MKQKKFTSMMSAGTMASRRIIYRIFRELRSYQIK